MAKAVWTDAQIIAQLDTGAHWSGTNLTYGFPTNAAWFPYSERTGFSELKASQQAVASLVIKMWDDLIVPDFRLAANGATANIKYDNTTTNIGYAHAYFPGSWSGAGSVWFNPNYGSNSGTNNLVSPTAGQWGFSAYIHETGHALGLDHPGTYNGGSPTYTNDALYTHDTQQYTIMSYFDAYNTGADWVADDGKHYYAQTPMMDDIMAIQSMYGAETTTRTGNTVYGFNSNADLWLFDFTQNRHPVLCIYDSSGNDTIDLSGWNYACLINLTPGSFSNADMMTSNISIARTAWIENAIGGGGNDTLIGNAIANVLDGRGGNDILTGGGGGDVFVYGLNYGKDIITDFTVSGADADVIDFTAFDVLDSFFAIIGYAAQVGVNTVFTFSSANTLTLYNVTLGTLTVADFYFSAPAIPNQAPTGIVLGNDSVDENALGAVIGSISVVDPDGDSAFAFTLSDARFIVTGAPGAYQLKLADKVALDYETEHSIDLTVTATDAGGLSTQVDFTITVIDRGGALIMGTAKNDVIDNAHSAKLQPYSGGDDDTIYALGGNDIVHGGGGDDIVYGDAGNDLLYGDAGNDMLYGGDGNDTLCGGGGNDTIDGGGGVKDTASYADATSGVTVDLNITSAQDTGGAGIDTILNIENLIGGSGDDVLTGNGLANTLLGGGGNDVLSGMDGNDTIDGGDGNDTIDGGAGNDKLIGGNGTDTLSYASDTAGVTIDLSKGSQKNASAGNDKTSGFENLTGGSGNDTLVGSKTANVIVGGNGNDVIDGSGGIDTLTGGAGNDQFRFTKLADAGDTITDFNNVTEADTIGIVASGFKIDKQVAFGTGDAHDFALHYFVNGGSATESGHGQFLFDAASRQLLWDSDGTGSRDPVLVASFASAVTLHAADFDLH